MATHIKKTKTASSNKPKLSSNQRRFQSLSQKIAAQRELIASWKNAFNQYEATILTELNPLVTVLISHKEKMLKLLDNFYSTAKFTKRQREQLADLILHVCEQLIVDHERDDLKVLYNKYSGMDFDEMLEKSNMEGINLA
ncbi:hypothetical protein TI04_09325, partial [Achromatium sp. WMS2]